MILRAEIVAYRSNTEVVPSSTFLHSAFFYRLNGEVEGPPRSANQAPRAREDSVRPRHVPPTDHGPLQRLLGSTAICWVMHTIKGWYLSKVERIYAF